MNEIIEAGFFPPAVEIIKDTSHAVIADNDPDALHSMEPSLKKASGSSIFEVSDAKASSKRAESWRFPRGTARALRPAGEPGLRPPK
jgi:hypothetical protein